LRRSFWQDSGISDQEKSARALKTVKRAAPARMKGAEQKQIRIVAKSSGADSFERAAVQALSWLLSETRMASVPPEACKAWI